MHFSYTKMFLCTSDQAYQVQTSPVTTMGLYGEELSVFHKSFIGKKISFTEEYPSTWTLTEKLGDKCDRYDEHDYEHEGSPSTGFGTFLCENVKDPNEKAIMKITMQYRSLSDFLFSVQVRSTDN